MVNGEWLRAVTIYHSPFTIYLLDYPQEVRDLLDDAAHRAGVGALKNLVELREPDAAHDFLLRLREADGAAVVLDADLPAAVLLLVLFRHFKPLQFFDLLAAQARHLERVLHVQQPVEGRAHDVVRVAGAE